MRWSGRIFWLLACEEVESLWLGDESKRKRSLSLNSQHSTLNCFTPSSRLHRYPLGTIGLGKSYPVTAAQLLPVSTGFLAPIHFFKLAKNLSQNYSIPI